VRPSPSHSEPFPPRRPWSEREVAIAILTAAHPSAEGAVPRPASATRVAGADVREVRLGGGRDAGMTKSMSGAPGLYASVLLWRARTSIPRLSSPSMVISERTTRNLATVKGSDRRACPRSRSRTLKHRLVQLMPRPAV